MHKSCDHEHFIWENRREFESGRTFLMGDYCERVQLLLSYVEHHEDEENNLMELVFTEGIGTKD